MKKFLLVLFVFTLQLAIGQIAYTSFEEPTNVGGTYTDTGDAGVDHALINNSGEPDVNFTSSGGEIGFTSYYYNTRDDVGLTDGDFVGVTNYTGTVSTYPDGSNGFELSDTDGKMTVTFEVVSLVGHTNPNVSLQYFVQSTGYESDDLIRIWLVVDGGTEVDLLNTTGSDINDLGIEGSWLTLSSSLAGYTTATLKVEIDCNSGSEALYIDDVQFVAGALDTEVKFASSDASVDEGDGSYNLLVSIVNPDAGNATSADVVLISGDAADIDNYTTQSVTFPAGSSDDQTVVITITDDSDIEGDEILTFELQNVSGGHNASVGTPGQFELTIQDNDFAPTPNIVINEIIQNPAAVDDTDGEWFELFNPTDSDVNINGWTIKDDGSDSHVIDNGGDLIITAGGYLVLGINGDQGTNGGVSVDYVYSGYSLANGDDEVVLIYSDGASEVDRVNYDNGSTFPDPNGASMELRNPSYDNNVGTNWDVASAPYGDGDLGTPGAQNTILSALEPISNQSVTSFKLYTNYPNPFNPSTTLRFDVPQAVDQLELTVYDILGKKVNTLYSGSVLAGQFSTQWNGTNQSNLAVPSGVYFAVLKTQNFSQSIKMMLLK